MTVTIVPAATVAAETYTVDQLRAEWDREIRWLANRPAGEIEDGIEGARLGVEENDSPNFYALALEYLTGALEARELGTDNGPAAKPKPAAVTIQTVNLAGVPEGLYTVVFEDGEHRTYRIKTESWIFKGDRPAAAGTRVLGYLSGPENTADYSNFAFVTPTGQVKVWGSRAHLVNSKIVEGLAALAGLDDPVKTAGAAYALRSNRCQRCGRDLTHPVSIDRMYGPECINKIGG